MGRDLARRVSAKDEAEILVIDGDAADGAAMMAALSEALAGRALRLVGDAAGFGALDDFSGYALVVCDWRPAWTTSRTVARLVKAEAPACRVLVVSRPMPFLLDFPERVREAGADAYAEKSERMERVCAAARRLLGL